MQLKTIQRISQQEVEDTEDEGDHSSQCQSHSEVGHPVVEGGHSHPVGEHTLQAHEQQPCWKRHSGSHVVQRFGVIDLTNRAVQLDGRLHTSEVQRRRKECFHVRTVYLEVSHHDQTHSVGAARHQSAGVDPAAVAVFDHLGVAQKAHHHHCRDTRRHTHSV